MGKNLLEGTEEKYYDGDGDTQKDKYLTFHLAGEDYSIEIQYGTEIIGIQKITEVPDVPGVVNLRGKVIPVMDVRTCFKLPSRDYDDRTCIIVASINDRAIGLVVDQVSEVADILENQIEPPPHTAKGEKAVSSGDGQAGCGNPSPR